MTYVLKDLNGMLSIANILIVGKRQEDVFDICRQFQKDEIQNSFRIIEGGFEMFDFLTYSGTYKEDVYGHPHLVIIVDPLMDIDSLYVIEEMRKDEDLHHLPIILLADTHKLDSMTEAITNSQCAIMQKPFDLKEFNIILGSKREEWNIIRKYFPTKNPYSNSFD